MKSKVKNLKSPNKTKYNQSLLKYGNDVQYSMSYCVKLGQDPKSTVLYNTVQTKVNWNAPVLYNTVEPKSVKHNIRTKITNTQVCKNTQRFDVHCIVQYSTNKCQSEHVCIVQYSENQNQQVQYRKSKPISSTISV